MALMSEGVGFRKGSIVTNEETFLLSVDKRNFKNLLRNF